MSNVVMFPAAIRGRLRKTSDGKIKVDLANTMRAVREMNEFRNGAVFYDEFRRDIWVSSEMRWGGDAERAWEDHDTFKLTEAFQLSDCPFKFKDVENSVITVAKEHRRNPLKDYLAGLEWDGRSRVDTWLSDYLGVADTPYARSVGAKWLISAVARVMQPGCKADCMLVLEGGQGTFKSSTIRALAGAKYFTDSLPSLDSKDAFLQLRGSWIIELPELKSLREASPNSFKSFISKQDDRFRPPYERGTVNVQRACVFIGTTNEKQWMADPTGGRRFWPVRTGFCNIEAISRDRGQLWAEVVHRYRAGETWWLDDPQIVAAAGEEAMDRLTTDPWLDDIVTFLKGKDDVSTGEILAGLGVQAHQRRHGEAIRVGQIMELIGGWEKYRPRGESARQRRYRLIKEEPL